MNSEQLTVPRLRALLGHLCLSPTANEATVERACCDAAKTRFGSLLVHGGRVRLCHELLQGTGVALGAVVGWPLGCGSTEAKLVETVDAVEGGATEIVWVMNPAPVLDNQPEVLYREAATLAEVSNANGVDSALLVEPSYFSHRQLADAAAVINDAPPNYLAVGTGYGLNPTSERTVRLLRRHIGGRVPLWAIGGVHTWADCARMIDAGMSRISTGETEDILSQFEAAKATKTAP